ncbi:MAG: hypothetical protein COA71_13765 [SAR86 cluster bacterium]|uniref:KilA-N DNA-binding domain-containing protein n=1 Tax=SAR86 cluster bacterium TaxID=2030880 RepID=A0A2A5C6J9_9GAMM|nr:MAG: hypothetical protein COA71_13765 [SAR86 cluster bacterium]
MNEITAIEKRILLIRSQKVLLDSSLAELYGVETKVLLQAVKRNIDRFPKDFIFSLTKQEFNNLRSQFVTSSWGGRRTAKLNQLEQRYDKQFKMIFDAIKELMIPPDPKHRPIGFVWDNGKTQKGDCK